MTSAQPWSRWATCTQIENQEPATTAGYVRLTLEDGTVIDARGAAVELYVDASVRRHAQAVVKPLQAPGVETLEPHSPTTPPVTINAADAEAFEPSDIEETVVCETETEMLVEVAAPTFRANDKWRLSNGTSGSFWATIGDGVFLDRVNAGEPFRKGDTGAARIIPERSGANASPRTAGVLRAQGTRRAYAWARDPEWRPSHVTSRDGISRATFARCLPRSTGSTNRRPPHGPRRSR